MNPASIQHQGYHALYLTRHFGNLASLQDPKDPNPIYFNILRLGLIYYPIGWIIPIMMMVSLVFAGVVALGFRRKCLTLSGIGLGALVFAVSLLTAPVIVRLLWAVLSSTVPAYQVRYYGHAVNEPLLLAFFASVAIAVTSAWYALLQRIRKVRLPDLTQGAVAILFVVMVFYSIISPDASSGISWSMLFSLLAAGYWFSSVKKDSDTFSTAQILVLLAAAIVAIVLLVPGVYMSFTGSDTNDLFMPIAVLVVLVGLLIPPLHIITKPKKWWLPVMAGFTAIVLLGVAILG